MNVSPTIDQAPKATLSPRQVRMNRFKLLGIFAVALVPLFLALAMYFGAFAIPETRTNKGNLIWPPLILGQVASPQGELAAMLDHIEKSGKWQILLTGSGPCEQTCETMLYMSRQVNIAMGREADRVARIVLATLPAADMQLRGDQASPITAFSADERTLASVRDKAAKRGADAKEAWQLWIVDPLGNIPLQYTQNHDGYDLMDDLKKLLKLSKIG